MLQAISYIHVMRRVEPIATDGRVFADEGVAMSRFRSIRWRDGPFCPYCNARRIIHFRDLRTHKCASCAQRFSTKVGTIFQDTKVPLHKWFIVIALWASEPQGVDSKQMAKKIGVTQKTAWYMLRRLRLASMTPSFNRPLGEQTDAPLASDATTSRGT